VSGAPRDASGQPTNKAAVDWLIMGAEEGTRDMTWEQIEEGADKVRVKGGKKGGKTAQILARAGALVSGAPRDASGRPTKKAAMDWLLMGAEKGTRDMTWEQIEEGAAQIMAEGRETWLIVARAGALDSGAPRDASGQPTNRAILDWGLMGAEEGTRDMTWEQIEEGAAKVKGEGGSKCKTAASRKRKREGSFRTGQATKAAWLLMAQDDSHSHACILPECGLFCTPEFRPSRTSRTQTDICFRHLCRVDQKQIYGLRKHMCRNCHRMAAQCRAAVCTHIAIKTAQILRASSHPGRHDENFRDGSVCAASCRLFASR